MARKKKPKEGVRTGEIRGGRMKNTGRAGGREGEGKISPWLQ